LKRRCIKTRVRIEELGIIDCFQSDQALSPPLSLPPPADAFRLTGPPQNRSSHTARADCPLPHGFLLKLPIYHVGCREGGGGHCPPKAEPIFRHFERARLGPNGRGSMNHLACRNHHECEKWNFPPLSHLQLPSRVERRYKMYLT